jgi:hypothetical protein
MRVLFLQLTLASMVCLLMTAKAQSPQPVLIQAQTPAPSTAIAAPTSRTADLSESDAVTLRLLGEMKKANEATLQKQEAALKMLDEMQKAAEQIRIYTKRT